MRVVRRLYSIARSCFFFQSKSALSFAVAATLFAASALCLARLARFASLFAGGGGGIGKCKAPRSVASRYPDSPPLGEPGPSNPLDSLGVHDAKVAVACAAPWYG